MMTTEHLTRLSLFMAGLWVSTIWSHYSDRSLLVKLLMACLTVALWPTLQALWLIDRAVFLYRLITASFHRKSSR